MKNFFGVVSENTYFFFVILYDFVWFCMVFIWFCMILHGFRVSFRVNGLSWFGVIRSFMNISSLQVQKSFKGMQIIHPQLLLKISSGNKSKKSINVLQPWTKYLRQKYTMFITNNHALFHFW